MRNQEVLKKFFFGCENCKNSSKNLENIKVSDNINVLYNYNAKIAVLMYNKEDKSYYIIINQKYLHYSKTTQKHINYIINLCKKEDMQVIYKNLYD